MSVALDGVDAAILDVRLPDGRAFPVAERLTMAGIPFLFCSGTPFDVPRGEFPGVKVVMKPASAFGVVESAIALMGTSGA
jgi:hypothetical protein